MRYNVAIVTHDRFCSVVLAGANTGEWPLLTIICGGSDFVRLGATGWLLLIHPPDLLVEKLNPRDQYCAALATMVGHMHRERKVRACDDVGTYGKNAPKPVVPGPLAAGLRVHP